MSWILTKSIHNTHESTKIVSHTEKYNGGVEVQCVGEMILVNTTRTALTREHSITVALTAKDAQFLISEINSALAQYEHLKQFNAKLRGV